VSNLGFLAVGYGFIWLVLGGYLFSLARRQSGLNRQVDRLEHELELTSDLLSRASSLPARPSDGPTGAASRP